MRQGISVTMLAPEKKSKIKELVKKVKSAFKKK